MNKIIIANWKMNQVSQEIFDNIQQFEKIDYPVEFLLAPSVPYLFHFANKSLDNIRICAQDVSSIEGFGAYTGEYSAKILKECGVNYAIIGHSERRNILMESNDLIKQKFQACVNAKITPIVCVGEDLESRKNNNFKEKIVEQIIGSTISCTEDYIIAYEPLWAIGSGITPTVEEIAEILYFLRTDKKISQLAKNARLVYGGSVSSGNSRSILSIDNNDGIMIGSASVDKNELKKILNNT